MNLVDKTTTCEYCDRLFPLERTQCPHCARPQRFPNVVLAEQDEEKRKLFDRYDKVKEECKGRGHEAALEEFERACDISVAVFNCAALKLFRQVATGTDLFETYHDLERLRIRSERPAGHDWQKLRPQAEIELLGTHKHLDKLHYATLSLDGGGLDSYGDCTVTLNEQMISHRASCFEGNSALIYEKTREKKHDDENEHDFSDYLRSTWSNRAKLCAAKIGGRLDKSLTSDHFPGMLLRKGVTQDDDEFVEVHVFGTMTSQTLQSVTFDSSSHSKKEKTFLKTLWKAVKEKLDKSGVQVLEK